MKYNSLKLTLSFSIMLCFSLLMGCEEAGEGINSPSIGDLIFNSYVKDPITFDVYINDDLIGQKKQFKYYSRTVGLKIVETISRRVIFDGDFPMRPVGGGLINITVWQEHLGSLPYCLMPPADEPAPPPGYGKISIIYNLASLPDSLKAIVENPIAPTSTVFTPTDSLMLYKNEISRFFLGRYGPKKAQVRLYTASGQRRQIAVIDAVAFYNLSQDFSQYISTSISGGVTPQLSMTRTY